LNETYGNITAQFLFQYPAPSAQTGDTQLAVMDYAAKYLYVAYSYNDTEAYLRPMMAINLGSIFQIQVPTSQDIEDISA